MDWRLITRAPDARYGREATALSGAANMAVDHLLLESVQAGAPPALRFYGWDPACLSLGRNQPAPPRVPVATAARGVDLVRRPTGGMAVYHHQELTYAIAVPVGVLGTPRATYLAVNQALVAGLRRLGVAAETAVGPPARTAAPRAGLGTAAAERRAAAVAAAASPPCFQAAAAGEVVVGGRKLVGSAQRREGRGLLQHGSLLLDGDQDRVAELLGAGGPGAGRRPDLVTLAELLGAVPPGAALVEALCQGFHETLGIRLAPVSPASLKVYRLEELAAHYRSAAWTLRRQS